MHVCGVCLKYVGGGEQIRNDWHSLMNSSAQKHTCPPPPPPHSVTHVCIPAAAYLAQQNIMSENLSSEF